MQTYKNAGFTTNGRRPGSVSKTTTILRVQVQTFGGEQLSIRISREQRGFFIALSPDRPAPVPFRHTIGNRQQNLPNIADSSVVQECGQASLLLFLPAYEGIDLVIEKGD